MFLLSDFGHDAVWNIICL